MAKKIRVWDGTQWQDVAPSLPYTAIHSAQASMPLTGVDGQVWLDTDGTLAGQDFVPLSGGTMTGNLNVPSINSGPIVGRNKILNGDFSIWQRGTSVTSTNGFLNVTYLADRWYAYYYVGAGSGPNYTWSRESLTPGSIEGFNGQYFARHAFPAFSATAYWEWIHRIEDVRSVPAGAARLSYWARVSSGTPIGLNWEISQHFGSGGSASIYQYTGFGTLTSEWQRIVIPLTIGSLSGKNIGANSFFQIKPYFGPTGSSGGAFTVDITGIQLESGSQVTPFNTATPNQQTELAACQRYYWRQTSGAAFSPFANGFIQDAGNANFIITPPVPLRIIPTSVDYSTLQVIDSTYTAMSGSWALGISESSNFPIRVFAFNGSGMTGNRPAMLRAGNSTSAFIAFSAEL